MSVVDAQRSATFSVTDGNTCSGVVGLARLGAGGAFVMDNLALTGALLLDVVCKHRSIGSQWPPSISTPKKSTAYRLDAQSDEPKTQPSPDVSLGRQPPRTQRGTCSDTWQRRTSRWGSSRTRCNFPSGMWKPRRCGRCRFQLSCRTRCSPCLPSTTSANHSSLDLKNSAPSGPR